MIKTVTITGADNSIKPEQLIELSQDFPFVEWGILVSPKSTGQRSRFPSQEWIEKLGSLKTPLVNLSLHLCGNYVNDFMLGNLVDVYNPLHKIWQYFGRVQVNTHGEFHKQNLEGIKSFIHHFYNKEFIIQNDGNNDNLLKYLSDSVIVKNFSTLFDMSHGAGILPETWPEPLKGIKCGFAGGIGPDNIIEQAGIINNKNLNNPTWIDMETKVMSIVKGETPPEPVTYEIFDLNKVRDCLMKAEQLMES